jgi:hypothetical protein
MVCGGFGGYFLFQCYGDDRHSENVLIGNVVSVAEFGVYCYPNAVARQQCQNYSQQGFRIGLDHNT